MTESQVRQYLAEMLPALAEMADGVDAPDLGEAAFALRVMAHRVAQPPQEPPAPIPLRRVS